MNKTELQKMKKDELVELALSLNEGAVVTEFPEPTNLLEALNQLMGRVGYVQKTSSNELPYTFASEPEFIRAIRPHMVDLGLTIHPIKMEHLETIQYLTKRGAQAFNRTFLITFRITHAPTKEHIDVQTIGEGTDYGDKSCNKAMTVALKYALRQSLLIETGDDPDQFSSEDFVQERRETKPRTNGGPRMENQWEDKVIKKIIDVGLYDNRPHAVNVLNYSPFMKVPYGDLTEPEAIAYVIMWQIAKEKSPDLDSPERAEQVNKAWQNEETRNKYIDQAFEMLGVEEPVSVDLSSDEVFDSGLGYD